MRGAVAGAGNRRGGPLCCRLSGEPGIGPRMNQSLLQLLGFVVLAAIVLATGFGAI
jgi:hypothetical protein